MKTTIRIAKLELNNLMFSPLSWLIMVGLTVYVMSSLFPLISHYAFNHSLYFSEGFSSLTHRIYTFPHTGFFEKMSRVFMILIPLLSMGIISRESNTGTIKLLYSSPIKLRSIVIGKYLALMTFVSIMMLIVFAGVALGWVSIYQFDIGRVMAAFIAFYFMSALIAAICVFVSTYSSYPVVDAVAGIAVVFGLNLLYGQLKDVEIISDIFYWLSIVRQIEKPVQGLLTSSALGYFAILTLMFLLLAYLKMALKRQVIKARRVTNLVMLLVFVTAMGLIYVLNQPTNVVYKDMSRNQNNVLHPESKAKLKAMKGEPVEITTYINLFGSYVMDYTSQRKKDQKFLSKYLLDFPQIKQKYKFYYNEDLVNDYRRRSDKKNISTDTLVSFEAGQYKIDLSEIIKYNEIVLDDELKSINLGQDFRVIRSGDNSSVLQTMYYDPGRVASEAEITAALIGVISDQYHVAMVDGHNGRHQLSDNSGYNKMLNVLTERYAWINNGARLSNIKLYGSVPEDVDLLLLADPTSELTEAELEVLYKYIERGGNLLLTGEPARRDIFNKITKGLGIEMLPGKLVNDNPNYSAEVNLAEVDQNFIGKSAFAKQVQLQSATALKVDNCKGFKVTPLIVTNEKESWLSESRPDKFGEIVYQPENGDKKEKYTVAVTLERKVKGKQQKILVAADADIISNGCVRSRIQDVNVVNELFRGAMLKWYTDGLYPLSMKPLKDLDLKTTLKWKSVPYYRFLLYFVMPGIFLLIGLFMLIKRMRN